MKKQTKRVISLILSCLMIFSGMTLSVFANDGYNVQVADSTETAKYSSTIDFEKYSSIADTKMTYNQAKTAITDAKSFGDLPSYYIASDGSRGYVLKAVNETSGEITCSNSYVDFYAFSDKSVKAKGKMCLEFDFNMSHPSHWAHYMAVTPYYADGQKYSTKNIMADGSVAGIGALTKGWHTFKGEFDLDNMTYSYSVDGTKVTNAQGSLGSSANGILYYRIAMGLYSPTSSGVKRDWAVDNIKFSYFETTNLANDIKENCTVSVVNADAVKIGKVMTVNTELYPDFESAQVWFDDKHIDNIEEESSVVRYLIPDDVTPGAHKVKLVASYSAIEDDVVKEQSVIVGEKDAPDYSSTIDFEKYSNIADTKMTYTEAASAINVKALGYLPKYYITSDADRGYVLKGVNETDGYEISANDSYAELYAFSDKSQRNSGKLNLEFDFYISHAHWSNLLAVKPYDSSGLSYSSIKNVMADGSVAGIEGYLTAGWHTFNAEFDLDSMQYSYSVDGVKVTNAQGTLTGSASGISYYRISISTYKKTSDGIARNWAVDNIKFTYSDTPIYESASYVKGADEFAANKVIACDAEAIKLNVTKEYGSLTENDVTVKLNDATPVAVTASYANGAITVPLSNLGVANGDKLKVTVSHNALLADGTYVDEPVVVEFVAGDSNGGAIIVEEGKAKAYFGIASDSAQSATVYIAAYKDKTLEALTSGDLSVLEGASSYESASLTIPSGCDEIKCFVWAEDVKPIIKSIAKLIK